MLVETLANLPNSHVKTRKKAHSTRQKKKSKSPGKISKITSAMFDDFDREGFEPEIDFRAYKEQRALDNLRSLNDEFDSGSFKLEDEIQKFTKNFHLDVPQRVMHRNTSCNIIMNHPDQLPIETEPALNRSKSGLVKLPILSILKRTITSQDDKASRKAIDTSKNYCDTDQTKTVETQDETYMKTAQNFSHLMTQNVIESHKELVTTGRVKNFAKGTTRQSRSRAVSKNVKEEIEQPQDAKYSSVSPARGTDASTLVKEEGIIHQMQKNGFNVPNIGRRYTIKGLLKREKIPAESLTLKTESVLITDGPQQGSHDSPQNRLRTRGYLNTTKEEFFKGEERYLQGIAKVVQVRQASQPYRSKRESIILEDDSQLRNTYFRARAETRDIGKSTTDRESLIIKGPKVEETKETKEIMKDFSHKALKPPVLSEIRENMSMQGFNIFKSSQPTKENKDTKDNSKDNNKDKAKDSNLNSLISAPTTTRIPEEEAKQAKAAHARSKSSLYKTKIIMKGPSLLCILGSDKEAKFKDVKKNPERKSSGEFIVKQSVGIPPQLLSYLNDEGLDFRNQSMVTKTRGKPVEGNINRSSIFEEANFFQKRTTPPPDTTPFEREVSPHSPLLEAKKEMRLTYTPKRSLKPLHLCNKVGGLMI